MNHTANALFLSWCEHYNSPNRDRFLKEYEQADAMERSEKEAKDSVPVDEHSQLRDMRRNVCPIVRPPIQEALHFD